jgi:sugar lactone lactonase YvrE
MQKVDLLFKCKNTLGEGITWSSESQKLFWLDIGYISKLFKLDISSDKKEIFEFPEIITASSVKSKNEIILLSNNGLNIFDFSKKTFQTIVEIEKSIIDTRSNDGASDVLGRFWFGSMQNNFDKFGNNIPVKKI